MINELTIDQIERIAPSVMATAPMDDVSDRYSFVSTVDAIELIKQAGWMPYHVAETSAIKKEKKGYQRHIVKFTRGEMLDLTDQERFDLVLMNSHDRGTAFRLAMGIFRIACSNGLLVGDTAFNFSHKHIGFDQDAFLKSVGYYVQNGDQIREKVSDFKQIELNPDEKGVYAKAAAELISDDKVQVISQDLVRVRRYEDRNDSLWNVYNRAQENIMKGGARRYDPEEKRFKNGTRKVKAIDRDVKLNKALWTLTEKMAELKGVSPH